MFQLWLVSVVPGWVLCVVFVGVAMGLSFVSLRVVATLVPRRTREEHNELAGFIIAVIGAIYAVTLALVVVAVWEQRDAARADSEREASALSDLYRGAAGFSSADRQQLRARIDTYARLVVDDEWKKMARGNFSTPTETAFEDLWTAYLSVSPQTNREIAIYTDALDALKAASDYRRARLLANRTTLPNALWVALVAGYLITVGFANLFAAKDLRMQSFMNAALAAIISLGLWVTFLMDAPYSGDLAVTPEALAHALEMFTRVGH